MSRMHEQKKYATVCEDFFALGVIIHLLVGGIAAPKSRRTGGGIT